VLAFDQGLCPPLRSRASPVSKFEGVVSSQRFGRFVIDEALAGSTTIIHAYPGGDHTTLSAESRL
jgi:hypothetical protein